MRVVALVRAAATVFALRLCVYEWRIAAGDTPKKIDRRLNFPCSHVTRSVSNPSRRSALLLPNPCSLLHHTWLKDQRNQCAKKNGLLIVILFFPSQRQGPLRVVQREDDTDIIRFHPSHSGGPGGDRGSPDARDAPPPLHDARLIAAAMERQHRETA